MKRFWCSGALFLVLAFVCGVARSPAFAHPMKIDDGSGTGGGCNYGGPELVTNVQPGGLVTDEWGSVQSWFEVSLRYRPYSTYHLIARTDVATEGKIIHPWYATLEDQVDLYFTTTNYYIPQRLYVVGVPDCLTDGTQRYSFSIIDPYYPSCPGGGYPASNLDAPVYRYVDISPASAATSESGSTVRFSVRLNADRLCPPASDITVAAVSNDVTEGLIKSAIDPGFGPTTSLSFTPANWQQWQTLDVQGQRDGIPDGSAAYTVGLTTSAADPYFNDLTRSVPLTNTDVPLPDDSCFTRCGKGTGQPGAPPAGCSCSQDCGYYGSCCNDVMAECSGAGGTPPYPDPFSYGAGSEFYEGTPYVSVAASPATDAPEGTGVAIWTKKPFATPTRAIPGLTKIDLHKVETHEERAECQIYVQDNMWKVQSWVNWALNPDATSACAARALIYPSNLASPPSIGGVVHAQDVGAQSPQVVVVGSDTGSSFPIISWMKIENVDTATHARCLTYSEGGAWKLKAEGSLGVSDVWCDARMISWGPGAGLARTADAYAGADWTTPAPGEREVYLGPSNDRVCFLTSVDYVSHNGYPGGGGTCEISERNDSTYLKAKRAPLGAILEGVGCRARCIQFQPGWPPAPTLRGVVGPGETPDPGTDASVGAGSSARVNLYQSGAYDRPLVLVEGVDPANTAGPSRYMRLLSPILRKLQETHELDLWVVNVTGDADIIGGASREAAKAIGLAYTYDPDGAGPLPPWNVGNPGKKVAVAGFSQGGLDTRVALAAWEDGTFGPGGAWPISGLPDPSGPPPVSLFLSVNGPQQGANAPLSLQHTINDVQNSLADQGLTLPPDLIKALRSAPAAQMLRQHGCTDATGVVTENCGVCLNLLGARTIKDGDTWVAGDDGCWLTSDHDVFYNYADSRGLRANGYPQSVHSVAFSNGSYSPQGCANTESSIPCTGDPVAWASGVSVGSPFIELDFVDSGHYAPPCGGNVCARNSRIRLMTTVFDLEGGDVAAGRGDAVSEIPSPPMEITLIRASDLMPVLYIPTESALACPGTAWDGGCTVLDGYGRRDHTDCDAVCRAANRSAGSPRFGNVFSNPSNRNGLHVGLHEDLALTLMAYVYEYLVADGDGYFGAGNLYLSGGAPPTGEAADSDDADPSVH